MNLRRPQTPGRAGVVQQIYLWSIQFMAIIQNLKNDIKIMISSIDDAIGQLNLWQYYQENKQQGKEFLENMLDDISNGAFVFA